MDIVSKRCRGGGEELPPRPRAVRLLLSGALICASFGHSVDGVARIVELVNGSAAIFKGTQTRGHGRRKSHASIFNSNSWCDPFKTWQKVRLSLVDAVTLILMTFSRIPSTLSRTFRPVNIILSSEVSLFDDRHDHTIRWACSRSAAPLDRTVFPGEPRFDSLASRSIICGGLLDGCHAP